MRLGDLEALESDLIEHKVGCFSSGDDRGEAIEVVSQYPTVDAIPVVRCKDCALGDTDGKHIPGKVYCDRMDCMHGEGFYCADGRKKAKWGACDGA